MLEVEGFDLLLLPRASALILLASGTVPVLLLLISAPLVGGRRQFGRGGEEQDNRSVGGFAPRLRRTLGSLGGSSDVLSRHQCSVDTQQIGRPMNQDDDSVPVRN